MYSDFHKWYVSCAPIFEWESNSYFSLVGVYKYFGTKMTKICGSYVRPFGLSAKILDEMYTLDEYEVYLPRIEMLDFATW
jgi:hypothetical protein